MGRSDGFPRICCRDLLAMDLDDRVVCTAGGVAIKALPDFFKCNL